MLEADHRLMFRFPRWVDSAKALGREVRLLEFLGDHLTIPIPRPILVGAMSRPRGWPFFVYEKLPGNPLPNISRLSRVERERLTRFLLKLFTELSACRTSQLRSIGLPPGNNRSWAKRFFRLERRYRRVAAGRMPALLHERIIGLFRGFHDLLANSRFRPTLIHSDLWPSHILWNHASQSPVGVIDWEDSRFGDPAYDLAAFGGIGSEVTEALIINRKSSRDELFRERLLFYRRILPLQGLLFGMETRRTGIVQSHLAQLHVAVELGSL
jgi:aminoglycoside 2''-phosphotransferase